MDNSKKVRDTVKSSTLKTGGKTFFFDVNVAKNNKRYLKITESRITGEGESKEIKRSSLILFPEDAQNFQSRLSEVVGFLAQ